MKKERKDMELLNRILTNLPILKQLNGNKTVIGLMSLLVYLVEMKAPGLSSTLIEILGWLGVTLLPIGLVHKAIK